MKAPLRSLAVLGFAIGAPTQAHAHLVNTRLGDFYGGMLHPLTGLEDVLPWLALAILAAIQGPQRARWLLVVFPLALLVGAILSQLAPGFSVSPLIGAALVAATGLAVAAAVRLPAAALVALGGLIALLHGYHNGEAMAADTDRLLYISGLTVIGYAFVTLLAGLAIAFLEGRGGWRLIALRAGGSWVAAIGIMILGLQLRAAGIS